MYAPSLTLDDLELQLKRPLSHRHFFTHTLRFHPVAKIEDPEILRLIHLTYRLQYLKDCVLGHYLNERTLGIITIMVHNNYIEVIRHIQSRKAVMSTLVEELRNNNLLALRMVNEICMLLKGLEVPLPCHPRSTARSTRTSSCSSSHCAAASNTRRWPR